MTGKIIFYRKIDILACEKDDLILQCLFTKANIKSSIFTKYVGYGFILKKDWSSELNVSECQHVCYV